MQFNYQFDNFYLARVIKIIILYYALKLILVSTIFTDIIVISPSINSKWPIDEIQTYYNENNEEK